MEVGIERMVKMPYNPQHNGATKRKNQSIIDITKAMIHDLDLPMCFWEEARCVVFYTLHKCSHKILKDKALEVFTSEK